MSNVLSSLLSKVSPTKRKWIRRIGILLVIWATIYGLMRGFYWISPRTPEVYRVAYDSNWYPLSLYGKEHNVTAFSVDLLFAAARNQNIQVEMIRAGHQRLFELLEDGQVSAILTALTPDPKVEELYYFSDPYYKFGAVLVVKKGVKIESIEKLPKQRIAVMRGSPILFHLALDPTVVIVPYESPLIALDELSRGSVDAVLMDQLLSYLYFGGLYGDRLEVATFPLTMDGLRLVTLQTSIGEELIEKFNAGLVALKQSGKYVYLLDQWDLYDPEKPH